MNYKDIVSIPNDILLAEVGSLLAEGREVIIPTKGRSMRPFIVGERDSVRLRKHGSVECGDIVLAKVDGGSFVLHRVRKVDGNVLTLKGDGNLGAVEHCTLDDVLGAVEEIIRPDSSVAPSKGRFWNFLPRIVRRVILHYENN